MSEPVYKGFEYRVRLAVSIPRAWAEFLRTVAQHHYDWKCREVAKAGVVNALCNTACDGGDFQGSSYPIEWSDLDLLTKVMEQARYHVTSESEATLVRQIGVWILRSKAQIVTREKALAQWDAEQIPAGEDVRADG